MRLRTALLMAPAMASLMLAPMAAQAQWHRGPGWGGPPHYEPRHGGGPGALVAGALLGAAAAAVVAGAVAPAPAPVYVAPPPVVYAAPPPVIYAPPPAVVYAPAPYYRW
jgi:hypothetical protein